MKKLLQSFFDVREILRKDKMIILFSLLPIIIGIVIYVTLGSFIYVDGLSWGEELIKGYLPSESWGTFAKYILIALFTAGFYFFISFGFVLIVSLIASPFNDIISKRTEDIVLGKKAETVDTSVTRMFTNLFKTIVNEAKKFTMIIVISVLAILMGYIPIFIPIAMILSSILMAVNFLDYSWSRNELSFSRCLGDTRKHFFSYGLSGAFFLILISVPLINLFALPVGVIYFTILYCRGLENQERDLIEKSID